MKNKWKWSRLLLGLAAMGFLFIFQGASSSHDNSCFDPCSGTYIPPYGWLQVSNLTNNHLLVVLTPLKKENAGVSFQVTSPLSDPNKSIATKSVTEGSYIVTAFLIGAVDNTKLKLVLADEVRIVGTETTKIDVASELIF